ncbi:peptidase A4 family-domain-containing protein [Phanerochaete sordida]|uniref:Peptidase A4 family-domain-containing protein n=1 Tax=Phanerochaete sordida TaxID=48140 RepID=A0A9P3GR46_9APHY|nr:peptidase A4 family-domain-containing protein [Phanerochaete sordida]
MFVSALFAQALLATAALAIPTSKERHDARVARRAGGLRQSVPRITNSSHVEYSSNWAGAVYNSAAGTYKSVTASFVVPTPKSSGSGGSQAASAWVGIDGDSCGNAILQTGVDFNVDGGSVSFDAWYEWYPDYAYDFSGISFEAGDSVTLTVTASSTTKGTAVITNNSNGQSVSKSISSSSALCEQDAEWIVEDFEEGNSLVPFANFGTVSFTGASAKTASGSVGPGSANIIDIQQNGKTLTSVSTSNSGVTVKYI